MTEDEKTDERRRQAGTRFWIGLNLLLFPIPSHFSLLRAREFSLKKSFFHFGMTAFLVLVLVGAAFLQILFPAVGRLWMLLPIASGILIAAFNHRVIAQFQPIQPAVLDRKQIGSLLLLLALLSIINIIPDVDLIELQPRTAASSVEWMTNIPLWQNAVIMVIGMLVVMTGYITSTTAAVSFNRIIILYACFIVIASQVGLILWFACKWLQLTGGFLMEFMAILLAAVLSLDYWDATSFGQFTRRYVLLTCTKGLSFLFLWLCFLGLPQKAASEYLSYYHTHAKPAPVAIPNDSLIFSDQDCFQSGHKALSRLRKLFAAAFLANRSDEAGQVVRIMEGNDALLCSAGDDVCRLKELVTAGKAASGTFSTEGIPFFRPVDGAWDVFMTALIRQGVLSVTDVSEIIAGFKATLPKSSEGHLPDLEATYDIRYVAMATRTTLNFIPPSMENLELLLEKNLVPVLSLPLCGEMRWGALLFVDRSSGIAWFRIEMDRAMEKAMQAHFDANTAGEYRETVLSHQMIPVPFSYLAAIVPQIGEPVAVLTKDGMGADLLDRFGAQSLQDINAAMALVSRAQRSLESLSGLAASESDSAYARYLNAVVRLYDLITPKSLDFKLFPDAKQFNSDESWTSRIQRAENLVREMGPFRDMDRIPMAHYLVENNLVDQAPKLFIQLALPQPVSTNMVSCREAFEIGRRLFLMGRYPDALGYLSIAHARHPYNSEYEIWRHLVGLKLNQDMKDFRTLPKQQPGPWLYYRTLSEMQQGKAEAARKRLEKAIERDRYDSMANHLLEKYFQKPLDHTYFFPSPEGL